MEVIYGCACTDCRVHAERPAETAPVAYTVVRGGKQFNVCTRCNLSDDEIVALLVNRETPAGPFVEYDAIGAVCLCSRMNEPEPTRRFR